MMRTGFFACHINWPRLCGRRRGRVRHALHHVSAKRAILAAQLLWSWPQSWLRTPPQDQPTNQNTKETPMPVELLIEGEEACTLASELASLTGESLEWVVVTALRERIEREVARRDWQDRIMAITREIATTMRDPAANDRGAVPVRRAAAG
jgi:hypothetical protein